MKIFASNQWILLSLLFVSFACPSHEDKEQTKYSTPIPRQSNHCVVTQIDQPHCQSNIMDDGYARLVCQYGFDDIWFKGIYANIHHLILLNWQSKCLSLSNLSRRFPDIVFFELINSTQLYIFHGEFRRGNIIEMIRLRGLSQLYELPKRTISRLRHLRILDLRANALRHVRNETLSKPPLLTEVYMADNAWDCSDGGLNWLALEDPSGKVRTRIIDYDKLMCHQRLYSGKPLHTVMDIIKVVLTACPESCTCQMTNVVQGPGGMLVPLITVDCSYKDLKMLPMTLPPNTTTVKLEGNQIESIQPIIQNPYYHKVVDLYLDNNKIKTIKELEGSDWITNFRLLSLRGNMLLQLPAHALDHAFQRNPNLVNIYLGNNPWRCDCHFTPAFKQLLFKYQAVIPDLDDVRCSKSDDKDISLAQIKTLTRSKVCKIGYWYRSWRIHPFDALSIVFALLTILILTKLAYDYIRYKSTGQLPWISAKMP